MLRIWGRRDSSATQKVLLTCHEIDLAYEFIETGGEFGGLDDPAYLAMNPTYRIPTIDDDGHIGWESNSCVRYLAAKHAAGTLWPEDLRVRAEADKWMDWQNSHWMDIVPAFAFLVRGSNDFGGADAVEASRLMGVEAYTMLNDRLTDRSYVAGDDFTMGDIALASKAHQWLNLELDRPAMPHLEAWYQRLKGRPTFDKTFSLPLS